MDNTIDALKKLYVALGGNIEDVENIVIIPDMINAIAGISKPFIITLTATSASAAKSDKTAAEIMEAFEAGRKIVVVGEFDSAEQTLNPIAVSLNDGQIAISAIGIQEPSGIMLEALLPWADDDDNDWQLKPYTLTPTT